MSVSIRQWLRGGHFRFLKLSVPSQVEEGVYTGYILVISVKSELDAEHNERNKRQGYHAEEYGEANILSTFAYFVKTFVTLK